MPGNADSGFSDARKALLKALEALQPLGLQNFVLVGAQAVYLRTTRVVPQMPPFTTDADLVVDPRRIVKRRAIYDALERLCCVEGPAVSLLRERLGWSREADILLASIPELVAEFCAIIKATT